MDKLQREVLLAALDYTDERTEPASYPWSRMMDTILLWLGFGEDSNPTPEQLGAAIDAMKARLTENQ